MSILYVYASPGAAPAVPICRLWRFFLSLPILGRLLAPSVVGSLLLALGLAMGVTVQAAIPEALRPVMIGAVQRDAGPSYRVQGAQARNTAQGWRLKFAQSAVEIEAADGKLPWTLTLGLSRLGSKEALRAYPVVKRTVSGNRVSYDRGLIEEWYVNGPLGLEQGFTLKQAVGTEIVLELALSWPAQAEGSGVRLTRNGKELHYGALRAVDANGTVLPSRMRVMDGRVRLEVAAQEAAYPVIIDPLLTEEARLLASDGVTNDDFGSRVALSGDGRTALIGAPGFLGNTCSDDFSPCGAAYVFVRKAGAWVEQQKIEGGSSTNQTGEALGTSVALSSDGNTALIGVPGASGCAGIPLGGADVFVRTEGVWVRRQRLGISDCPEGTQRSFGFSVALSADGKVALLGRPGGEVPGHAYVFVRKGGRFVPEPPVTPGDEFAFERGSPIFSSGGEPGFGRSVALSGDGTRMLIGGNDRFTGKSGPVYVFKRSGAKWTELQKLTPPTGVAFDPIALAADGKTALIGAPGSLQAYVFVRRGVRFRRQQILGGPALNEVFGRSVSITAGGRRLLVGAPGVGDASGATYVFLKSGEIWKLRQALIPSDSPQSGFGASVALSRNGGAALVGSPAPPCPAGEFCFPQQPCGGGSPCGAAYAFGK